MELFRLEHKKLWKRNSVKISVLLCFIYVVILANILCFQWFSFGTSDDHTSAFGNNFDGYSAIRERQEYAHSFGEELTDQTLQQLVQDYQRMDAADREEDIEKTDHWTVNNWLHILWPELEDTGEYYSILMIDYVDPDKLTGLYERRQQALETFLENNEQTGAEREYLLQMNRRVKIPFRYGWTDGWSSLLGSTVADLGIIMALFIAIALSTLFAGEWHDRTGPLLLTTKNGWEKVAAAKILVGLSFTVELFGMLAAGGIISQLFFFGTTGWDMPIQSIKLIAVAPMNMLQGEIYEYVYTLLGAIGYAGVVMLLSAVVKSNAQALLLSLGVVYALPLLGKFLPYGAQIAIDCIPLAGSATDIFRTNTLQVFGKVIWTPWLLVSVPVLIGILCMPGAVKGWARRLKI